MKPAARWPRALPPAAALALVVVATTGGATIGSAPPAWTDGARGTLLVTAAILFVSTIVGLILGSAAALGSPVWDGLLARTVELTGAVPTVIAVAILRGTASISGLASVGVVLMVLRSLAVARTVRADAVQLAGSDFALAARALGSSRSRLFRKHLYPHLVGTMFAGAPFTAATVVGLDAATCFLGLAPTGGSWGATIARAMEGSPPTVPFGPVLGLAVTTAALAILADAYTARFDVGRRFV
jgi:peptide/nickel transport system permease protein